MKTDKNNKIVYIKTIDIIIFASTVFLAFAIPYFIGYKNIVEAIYFAIGVTGFICMMIFIAIMSNNLEREKKKYTNSQKKISDMTKEEFMQMLKDEYEEE